MTRFGSHHFNTGADVDESNKLLNTEASGKKAVSRIEPSLRAGVVRMSED